MSIRKPAVVQRLVDAYITGLRQRLPTACIRQLDQMPGCTEESLLKLRQSYPSVPAELLYMLQRVNGTYWETTFQEEGLGRSEGSSVKTSSGKPKSDVSHSTSVTTTQSRAAATATHFFQSTLKTVTGARGGRAKVHVPKQRIAVPVLGSSLGTCPYYLKSVEQMLSPYQHFPPHSAWMPRQPDSQDGHFADRMANRKSPSVSSSTGVVIENNARAGKEGAEGRGSCQGSIRAIYDEASITRAPPSRPVDKKSTTTRASFLTPTAKRLIAEAENPVLDPTWESEMTNGDLRESISRTRVYVDPRIDVDADLSNWLVFADSIEPHYRHPDPPPRDQQQQVCSEVHHSAILSNATESAELNGAATGAAEVSSPTNFSVSRLYIDFSPSTQHGGVCGQIVQYARNPDSFTVIAKDFGEYLKYLMAEEYEFTEELEDDDEEDADVGRDVTITTLPSSAPHTGALK